jgi:hypothetical protein
MEALFILPGIVPAVKGKILEVLRGSVSMSSMAPNFFRRFL